MSVESFRKSWLRDRVVSSEGFSIELRRDGIDYTDQHGKLRVDAEWAPGRGTLVIMYAESIPDLEARPRAEVVQNIGRAFDAAGWELRVKR